MAHICKNLSTAQILDNKNRNRPSEKSTQIKLELRTISIIIDQNESEAEFYSTTQFPANIL